MVASFSIVLPIYDSPLPHLDTQLRAIARQRGDFECIVVDDGSPSDAPAHLVERFARDDPRFRLIRRPANGGIAAATNDGIDAATNDWLVFCDHDDVIDEAALEAIAAHVDRHPEIDALYTDERVVDERGNVIAEHTKPDWSPIRQLGHHYPAHLTAVRRSALGDVRVRSEFEPAQDDDFWLQFTERLGAHAPEGAHRVGHIARPLYEWRAIEGSSALAAREKLDMCEAVRRCVAAAVERRGLDATARTVVSDHGPTTAVQLDWNDRPALDEIALLPVTAEWTSRELLDEVAALGARFIALAPDDLHPVDPDTWRDLAAEVAGRDQVVAAGPRVADAGGDLLSNGRTIGASLTDPYEGHAIDDGPWGIELVVREVSAISPVALVIDRAAFVDLARDLPDDLTLDVAIADLCRRARSAGRQVVVAPQHVVTADDRHGWRLDGRLRREHRRSWSTVVDEGHDLTEHHAPEGVRTVRPPTHTPYDEVIVAVDAGEVDLVTSDVFDTLVTRDAASPDHLFVTLGEFLAADGVLDEPQTPVAFATARRTAERRARRARMRTAERNSRPLGDDTVPANLAECTLEEIWDELGPAVGVDPAIGVAAEIDHEAARLEPVPDAVELIRQVADAGIPVVLVSDTYLSVDQLRSILQRVGLPLDAVADIVTSSSRRRSKADGLLAEVVGERGTDPKRVIHVGDNPVSDVAAAERIGATPCHVDLPGESLHVTSCPPAMQAWSGRTGTDLGVSSVVRRRLLSAQHGREPSYQLGAALAPAMFGFAAWIDATVRSLGVGAAHFLLREGATIATLADIVSPDGGIDLRRVHASRWVDVRATIFDGDWSEIRAAIDRRSPITTDHLAEAFELDHATLRSVVGSDPVPPVRFDDLAQSLAEHDELRSRIVDSSATLRRRVTGLLERELDVTQPTIVLVDVGWGGRLHEAIERLLRAAGHDQPVVSLFLALSEAGVERVAAGADMRSYLPSALDGLTDPTPGRLTHELTKHPDVIERILMPPTPTLVDVDDAGAPVLAPRAEARPVTVVIAQRGLHDVVRDLAARPFDDRWVTDLAWRGALASALHLSATRPQRAVAETLRGWTHDDVGGTDVDSLAGTGVRPPGAELVAATSARDIEALLTGTPAWVDLVAATDNPATATQRWAVADGHDLDLVAPKHPAGTTTLSVFADDGDEPSLQQLVELGATVDGWTVIRLAGSVRRPRVVRFDPGRRPVLVEIGSIDGEVRVGGETTPISITRPDDPHLRLVSGRVVDERRFAAQPDGHLLVPLGDGSPFASIDREQPWSITVTVRFRRWSIADDDPSLTATPIERAAQFARRGRRVAGRLRRAAARRVEGE